MKKHYIDKRCPKGLKFLPCNVCKYGQKKSNKMKNGRYNVETICHDECVWYVNNKQYNYCFWKYLHDNKDNISFTDYRPWHTLEEIALLWNTSTNNIRLRLIEAERKFLKLLIKERITDEKGTIFK